MIVDPCGCGLTPQIKEIKTIVYVAICPCGKHGPPMQIKDWAITEWNKSQEAPVGIAPPHGRQFAT